MFAGRIYAARKFQGNGGVHISVQVRPAYHAISYTRGTHFIQDKTSVDIFEALTKDITGFVKGVDIAPIPGVRAYSVRLDESEYQFLDRMLAYDGIMYFFTYERESGAFRHKMVVTNKTSAYLDVPGSPVEFRSDVDGAAVKHLEHHYRASAARHYSNQSVIKSDIIGNYNREPVDAWAKIYSHVYTEVGEIDSGDEAHADFAKEHDSEKYDYITGRSTEPQFFAGGRVEILEAGTLAPARVVLTAVEHNAEDPWMFDSDRTGSYSNSFECLPADKIFRPEPESPRRIAPGPVLGVVKAPGLVRGGIEGRFDSTACPSIFMAARTTQMRGFPSNIWLPVRQQWGAGGKHGEQFLPRAATRVVVDFLNGNPDLPYVDGVLFSPDNPYPDSAADAGLRTGWRSITDKDGAVTQEFFFEDKPGQERVWLYTDRNYEREIQKNEIGQIHGTQTITIDGDQTLKVHSDRKMTIDVDETNTIKGKRTTTVTGKSLHESKEELELKVGSSSIKMTPTEIKIKAMKIIIEADVKLDMKGGAQADLASPLTNVKGDGTLILKGGVVLIN